MTKYQDLSRCTGYRVETRDGRIGSVAAVLLRPNGDGPGVLLVHTGLLSCTLSAIPFDDVDAVDIGRRRVVLREELPAMRPGPSFGVRDRIVSGAS